MVRFVKVLGAAASALLLLGARPSSAEAVSFTRDLAPVLLKRCAGCHGERLNLGGYRLQTFGNLMRPGASGTAPVTAGKPEESRLFQLITAKSPSNRMPKGDTPLSPAQVDLFRRWILEGAKFDAPDPAASFLSLRGPRQHPAPPRSYRVPAPVLALGFARGGKEIAVGGYHEVTFWDSAAGSMIRRIPGLPQRIQALAFSPDGRSLLVGGGTPGDYGELALLDPNGSARSRILDTMSDTVCAVAFSRDGRLAAAAGADLSVRVYDVQSGKRLWTSRVHSDWVTSVSFSADGRFLASASKDKTVKVYEVRDGSLFATYSGHNKQLGRYKGQSPVYTVRFAPDSPQALSAGEGNWIQVWDPVAAKAEAGDAGDMEERFAKQSHARYLEHGFQREVLALVVRDGQVFAAAADGVLKQFDLGTGKEIRVYRPPVVSADPGRADWLYALDYDPVAGRIAVGSYAGEVRVWDVRTGEPVVSFRAQPGHGAERRPLATNTRRAAGHPERSEGSPLVRRYCCRTHVLRNRKRCFTSFSMTANPRLAIRNEN